MGSHIINIMLINALDVLRCRSFIFRSRKLDELHPSFLQFDVEMVFVSDCDEVGPISFKFKRFLTPWTFHL